MGSSATRSASGSLPWVSLLLATVFGLATIQAVGASRPQVALAEERLRDAIGYFEAHPYLEPGDVVRDKLTHARVMELRANHEQRREAEGDPPVIAGIMRRQQKELDGIAYEVRQAIAALPVRALGVDPSEWRPTTLLTYVALHSGTFHLAGSLLLLLLIGLFLEPALGPTRMLLVSTFATLGAGMGYAFSLPDVGHVMIGSSGMLAGLLVVFAWELRVSRNEGFYPVTLVGGGLWLLLPSWLGTPWSLWHPGVELLSAMPSPTVVYTGLAGGVAGAMSSHLVLRLLGGRRDESNITHSAKTSTGSATLDQALKERAAGREESAYQMLTVLLHKEPEQLDAALLLSDVARSLGRHDAAESAMLRAIRIEAKRNETAAAVRHWLDLAQREVPRGADPALLIRVAALLRHHDHPRAASEALREALSRATGSNTAPVAMRIARAAQELDPTIAHDAAWRALGCPELSLEERQNLEDLLAVVMPKLPGAEVMISNAWSDEASRPAAIEIETHTRVLDLVRAVPLDLDEEGLHIATRGGRKKRILYDRIDAVAVAAVQGLSQKPVLVIDVVLNWAETREPRLRVLRMRGDKFDPRRVVDADSPLEAFRRLVETLIERASATPLPDRESALGSPFASFEEMALYERTVLMAESPLSESDA